MESHIVAVDGKAVLHQSLTISFDSGLCDEIANPENHGKVDQVAQLAGELFSPFGAVDVSDLADDGTVTVRSSSRWCLSMRHSHWPATVMPWGV